MVRYDLLVYLGLIPLVAVIIFSGFVIWRTPTDTDLETRKIRMADAVLVGLLALFIFAAILYFVDPEGAGGGNLQQGVAGHLCAGGHHKLATFLAPQESSEARKIG
jgi:hypothetical protein